MPDAATALIHVRVDETLKARATEALANMGLTMSDAVRVLLVRVVEEQRFPFPIEVPNAETRAAMADARAKKDIPGRFATAEESFDALAETARS